MKKLQYLTGFVLIASILFIILSPGSIEPELKENVDKASYLQAAVYKDGGSIGILLFDSNDNNYLSIWIPVDKNFKVYHLTEDIDGFLYTAYKLNSRTKNYLINAIRQKNTLQNDQYVISNLADNESWLNLFK